MGNSVPLEDFLVLLRAVAVLSSTVERTYASYRASKEMRAERSAINGLVAKYLGDIRAKHKEHSESEFSGPFGCFQCFEIPCRECGRPMDTGLPECKACWTKKYPPKEAASG